MPTQKLTAEIRLYRWLKRKTTPRDAWQSFSLAELAAKAHCSTSQVSRTLPKVVAKLHDIPQQDAEKWVNDVMNVRRGRLIEFEVDILKALREKQPPVSYFRLASLFEVSEKQIADSCDKLGLGFSSRGPGTSYWGHSLIPESHQHRMRLNAEIRRQLREKQRLCSKERGTHFGVLKAYTGGLRV